jgi:hypothetical protein
MLLKTYRMEDDWVASNQAINVTTQYIAATQNEVSAVGSVTTNIGDRFLLAYKMSDTTSGYKLSSDMASANAFPVAETNQLHVSAHVFQFGNNVNGISSAALNQGTGNVSIVWIDRSDVNNCKYAGTSFSDPNAFGGILDSAGDFTLAGTDAGIGEQLFDLKLRGGFNRNPVKILIFPAGSPVPDSQFLRTCMEWMWYEWAVKNNHILYPPLR